MFNRPRPKTRSGYSLVEIIVASSVAFLILGILANLMISSGRVTRKGMVKVDLQQRMQKLNNDLSRDIGLSSTQGVAVDETATPTPLSIHRRETDTATVTWEPQVIVYHGTDQGELYDLATDPDEFHNLWNVPEEESRKLRLMKACFDASVLSMDPDPPRRGPF